jgi:hypothetical protein
MTIFYSQELAGIDSIPVVKPTASQYGGGVFVYEASIVLASQATTDTIVVGQVPAGGQYLFSILNTDTSLGTSTIAIGTAATPAKYRAAATFTTTNTPTLQQLVAASLNGQSLTATERQIITIAVATLPAAGNLLYQQFWAAQG